MKTMTKKALAILLALIMCIGVVSPAFADGGTCDICQQEITGDGSHGFCGDNVQYCLKGGTLTLYGKGSTWDYTQHKYGDDPYAPWVQYLRAKGLDLDYITQIVIEEGITRLGNYLFEGRYTGGVATYAVNSVEIPKTVEVIGERTFGWTGLRGVTFAAGSELRVIGEDAFAVNALTSVTLPAGLEELCFGAFNYNVLTNVFIPASVKSIGGCAFGYWSTGSSCNVTIEAGSQLETVDKYAFDQNASVLSLTVPANVASKFDGVKMAPGSTVTVADVYGSTSSESKPVYLYVHDANEASANVEITVFSSVKGGGGLVKKDVKIADLDRNSDWGSTKELWIDTPDADGYHNLAVFVKPVDGYKLTKVQYRMFADPKMNISSAEDSIDTTYGWNDFGYTTAGSNQPNATWFLTFLPGLRDEDGYDIYQWIGKPGAGKCCVIWAEAERVSEPESDDPTPGEHEHSFDPTGGKCQVTADCEFYGGPCGENVIWIWDSVKEIMTIRGSGAMNDFSGPPPWYTCSLKTVVIEDGVTHIGEASFSSHLMEDVIIGKDVSSIGNLALGIYCPKTVTFTGSGPIDIDPSVFADFKTLERVTVPAGEASKALAEALRDAGVPEEAIYDSDGNPWVFANESDPDEYTVTFIVDGEEWATQPVAAGDEAKDPGAPTIPAKTAFAGWYTQSGGLYDFTTETVTENLILYAGYYGVGVTVTADQPVKTTLDLVFAITVENLGNLPLNQVCITNNNPTGNGMLSEIDSTKFTVEGDVKGLSVVAQDGVWYVVTNGENDDVRQKGYTLDAGESVVVKYPVTLDAEKYLESGSKLPYNVDVVAGKAPIGDTFGVSAHVLTFSLGLPEDPVSGSASNETPADPPAGGSTTPSDTTGGHADGSLDGFVIPEGSGTSGDNTPATPGENGDSNDTPSGDNTPTTPSNPSNPSNPGTTPGGSGYYPYYPPTTSTPSNPSDPGSTTIVDPDVPLADLPLAFDDVSEDDWFYEAVMWAVKNGVTTGIGDGTLFGPYMVCDRAQIVTFLWRAAGSPEPTITENPFTDVSESDYFYKAVLWAVEKGITEGVGDGTTFGPSQACDRAQVAVFLCRAQDGGEVDLAIDFTDVPADAYYAEAVKWAVDRKITTGTGDGTTYSPDMSCDRAQIVTFLYRAYGNADETKGGE